MLNLSNGTTIDTNTFDKRIITGMENRGKLTYRVGIELQRKVTDRIRLTLACTYEDGVTYQLSSDLHQRVSAVYFGFGGLYRL